jgi:hypothetical protein
MEVFKFIVTVASTETFSEMDMYDAIREYDDSVCIESKLITVTRVSDDADESN